MKYFVACYVTCLLISISSCQERCSNPVYVKVSFAWTNDNLLLKIDDERKVVRKKFPEPFRYDNKHECYLIENYCPDEDSVKVYFNLNSEIDTTFYLVVNEVNGCYVGSNLKGGLFIFQDYKEGNLREYTPED